MKIKITIERAQVAKILSSTIYNNNTSVTYLFSYIDKNINCIGYVKTGPTLI